MSSDTTNVVLGFLLFALCVVSAIFFPLFAFFLLAVLTAVAMIYSHRNAELKAKADKRKEIPDINTALIELISVIMNADGQNTRQELDEVKAFLLKRFGEQKAKKMLLYLKHSLQKHITNIRPHCLRLNRSLSYPQKLEFLTLLFRIAEANGEISQYEAGILAQIARHIVIRHADFTGLTAQFSTFYNYQKKQTAMVYCNTGWAYKELMIEENASPEEIKKAYRKLAMLHHPDKVAPHDVAAQAEAAQKFQRINEAYRHLRKTV